MPLCTQFHDWIWDAKRGFCLVETWLPLQAGTGSFPSSPSHSIEKLPHMTYLLVWGCSKQERITRLHCTCRAVCASSWSGKSTSGGGQACRSTLNGGGWDSGGRSRYREYVETHWILGDHGATRVWHWQPWRWHRWVFYIDCDPTGGVACQEGHTLQVCSLDTRTKNRHAVQDDVGPYPQGILQAMLLKPVCNVRSNDLHRVYQKTRSRHWNFVSRWESGVHAGVLHSAPLCMFAAAHPATSEESCGSWLELSG